MSNDRKAIIKPFTINLFSKTIQSWLEYTISRNQSHVLRETSLDGPACDLLNQYMEYIELETKLKYFKRHRCDLAFKLGNSHGTVLTEPCYFEFKYTRKGSTRNNDEQQRVFDDLMRLNSIDEPSAKKFFLMAGSKLDFIRDFQYFSKSAIMPTGSNHQCPLQKMHMQLNSSIGHSPSAGSSQNLQFVFSCANVMVLSNPILSNTVIPSSCPIDAKINIDCPLFNIGIFPSCSSQGLNSNNVYNEMFSFDISQPEKQIDINNPLISPLISGFKKEYKKCCVKKNKGRGKAYDVFIDDIKKIKTTLRYITHNDCLARVAVWEVTKDNP